MIKLKSKRFLLVFITLLIAAALCLTASAETTADVSVDGDTDPLVTLSYVNEVLKPQIIAEVLEQLGRGTTVTSSTNYGDITLESGKMLMLGANCEFIYRGGGAVIITTSTSKGDGVSDMSIEVESFSGTSLVYGHIRN